MATGTAFHVVREFRFRLHWPPYAVWLDIPVTLRRVFRWLRLHLFLTKQERWVCDGLKLTRRQYAASFKELGLRRYR